jgi:folylpolyglutamate synthase/dihydropteroate synthase
VDYAVLECGLGGRLDSTNIVSDVSCAAITSIGMDHAEVLGHSLNEIAKEKAGIIKPGVRSVVIGPSATDFGCFTERAQEVQIDSHLIKRIKS